MSTLYASFATVDDAQKAAGALLDHGAKKEDLSIVAHATEEPEFVRNRAATGAVGTTTGDTVTVTDPDVDRDDDSDDAEGQAEHGITTTTGADAGAGAAKGAAWGLGIGALAALAAVWVPGLGIVLGEGALAWALGGAAGATAAGALAGGVHGYLVDQGVPEEHARAYNEAVEGGGAMIALAMPSGDLDPAEAEDILRKYGGANVGNYGTRAA